MDKNHSKNVYNSWNMRVVQPDMQLIAQTKTMIELINIEFIFNIQNINKTHSVITE